MPTKKKKKKSSGRPGGAAPNQVLLDTVGSYTEIADMIGRLRLGVPKESVGVATVVAQFASDMGYAAPVNCTNFFTPAHNGSACLVEDVLCLLLLATITKRNKNVIHFIEATASNIEAMRMASIWSQIMNEAESTTLECGTLTVNPHLKTLHAITVCNGQYLCHYDVISDADKQRVAMMLKSFSDECPVCLGDLSSVRTVSAFACGHPLCRDCAEQMRVKGDNEKNVYEGCPVCRETRPWNGKPRV